MLQGHREHFAHFCFSYGNRICLHCFFHQSQAVIIVVAGNIRKKCSFLKDKSCRKLLGWFFIILFGFSLSFIYTNFMFVVGLCNFDARENLKCVRQQGLKWYEISKTSYFTHHSKGTIKLFQKRVFGRV